MEQALAMLQQASATDEAKKPRLGCDPPQEAMAFILFRRPGLLQPAEVFLWTIFKPSRMYDFLPGYH